MLHDEAANGEDERITPTPPYGATVIVFRRKGQEREFLILHRAAHGRNFDGDWAWGPPSGSRLPDEAFDRCAKRELLEATGLCLALHPVEPEQSAWLVYVAETEDGAEVRLSPEHDDDAWLPLEKAINLVRPDQVRAQLVDAESFIDIHRPDVRS